MLAQSRGLEFAHLNHLFDAAPVRSQALLAPPWRTTHQPPAGSPSPMPTSSQPEAGSRKPRAATEPFQVVRAPAQTPAYRRTFRRLLSRPQVTDRYDDLILKYSRAYRLDPRLLKAIIAAESEFFKGAVSPAGARGLMQVMPATAEEMGVARERLHDPESNIQAGAAYIARLFSAAWRRFKLKGVRFHEAPSWLKQRVIASYHAGPRFLFRRGGWYQQTLAYVRKVVLFYGSRVTDFHRVPGPLARSPRLPYDFAAGTLH